MADLERTIRIKSEYEGQAQAKKAVGDTKELTNAQRDAEIQAIRTSTANMEYLTSLNAMAGGMGKLVPAMSAVFGAQNEYVRAFDTGIKIMQAGIGVLETYKAIKILVTSIEWGHTFAIIAQKVAQYWYIAPIVLGVIAAGIATAWALSSSSQAKGAQHGAVVPPTPGGQQFIVGEGGETEVILPESMLRNVLREEGGGGGNVYNIYALDTRSAVEQLDQIERVEGARG